MSVGDFIRNNQVWKSIFRHPAPRDRRNRVVVMLTNVILHFADAPNLPWWDHVALLNHSTWQALAALSAAFFATAWIAARFININKFSLHGMYRDRPIRNAWATPPRWWTAGRTISPGSRKATTSICVR